MSKHWFVVIMILVLQSFLYAETSAPKDPNLDKPVTLAVKGESLADILPMLEKQTGVKLRVTKTIAEQKATIFVDAKPLINVMHGLETLFGYKWSMKPLKDYRVYELWEPEKIRMERADISQTLASAIWKQLDSELAKKLQFYPKDENEIREAIIDAAEKYKLGLFNEDNKMRQAGEAAWAKVYLSIPPDVRTALLSGASAWYDTDTTEAEWRIPADLARTLASVEGGVQTSNSEVYLPPNDDIIHLNVGIESGIYEYDGKISSSMNSSFQFTRTPSKTDGMQPPMMSSCNSVSQTPSIKLPITDYLPPNRLPHKQDDTLYARAVEFTPEELAKEADVPGQDTSIQPTMVNRSDILSLLHKKLGLQIMADHYSKWIPFGSVKTLADCINSIEAAPDAPKAYWGWDGNFIYAHTRNVRQWSRSEIPNILLRSWRQAYTEQGWMNLDQLAEMALLSKEQLPTLDVDGHYMGIGKERDRIAQQVLMSINELRMYAVLSPSQRKEAFNGGTKSTGFTSQQLGALVQCVKGKLGMNGISRPFRTRVGIWKDGVRIDKPLTLAEEDPVLLVMHEGITSSGFGMSAINPNGGTSGGMIVVMPEGGNQPMQAQAQAPGYTMTFRFADGSSIDSTIPVGPRQGPRGFGQ